MILDGALARASGDLHSGRDLLRELMASDRVSHPIAIFLAAESLLPLSTQRTLQHKPASGPPL